MPSAIIEMWLQSCQMNAHKKIFAVDKYMWRAEKMSTRRIHMIASQLVRLLNNSIGIVKHNDLVTTDCTDAGLQLT